MMFVLLPVSALLLQLCYLFSPFHYLQHLVFALHLHSFNYLLYLIAAFTEWALPWLGDGQLFLMFLLYLPIALWKTYGSSIGGALSMSVLFLVSYSIMLVLGFAAVSVLVLTLY